MSTVNTGWLKDNNGEKFAPKTLSSQVITSDGISIDTLLDNTIVDDGDGNLILGADATEIVVAPHSRGVEYDNAVSGLSATNVQDAMDEIQQEIVDLSVFVTPQMYGAKGDGVTDDTEAFQNALTENDNVFVPKGNYLITDTLDISYKKSLVSDSGQRATILYNGSNSVISIGRMSVFRNINITLQKAFSGIVFDTNNYNKNSGECALESRVEHVNVSFEVASPNATLIGITIDSGADVNNIPKLVGVCFQTYHDIIVDNPSCAYGTGIRMELIQGRPFTEETKDGFPWITHIDYDDIFLGRPHTAIKATVTNTSGSERFERVSMGSILFNNVYTQWQDAESTQFFLDLDNISSYFTKCIGWDYHPLTWNGNKVNIIGENVNACFNNCSMDFGADFLSTCDFTEENDYTVADNPEYFINKYFNGTVLTNGYDSIDAKIDAKLNSEYIANITDEKITEILYSGYSNVLDDPLTQIKVGYRYSNSSKSWTYDKVNTTIIIPIVTGGNIIRWTPSSYELGDSYQAMFFFNDDDLSTGVRFTESWEQQWDSTNGYLVVNNPSSYKYVSLPFYQYTDITPETMIMTVNREIVGNEGKSYTEYLRESVIDPAINDKFKSLTIPTKTSQLENDSKFLTSVPDEYVTETELNAKGYLTKHQDISGKANKSDAETWTFTLADGSTVTKKVVLA